MATNSQTHLPGTKHVPVDVLEVDRYQTILDPQRVARIADNFDPTLFGTIDVVFRDGRYFITDGQHRVSAVRKLGWKSIQVPCVIHHLTGYEAEAKHLVRVNTLRRPPSAYGMYNADREAKDEAVLRIEAVLKAVGLKAVPHASADADGIRAVTTVRAIDRWHGDEMLERVLRITLASWPFDAVHGRGANTLDAIVAFIATHATRGRIVDDAALIKACSRWPAAQFSGHRATTGIPLYKAMAADLQQPYNRAAKRNQQVELLTPSMYSKRPRRPTDPEPVEEVA